MTMHRWYLAAMLLLWIGQRVQAQELDVSLRLHADEIAFGDPLYVEVTITNRGEEVVSGPIPSFDSLDLVIWMHDPKRDLMISHPMGGGGVVGGWGKVHFRPNEPRKYYKQLFLPNLWGIETPFWQPIQQHGQRIQLQASYSPYGGVRLLSEPLELRIAPRDKEELQVLKQIRDAQFSGFEKGPSPNDFGITTKRGLRRVWTEALAEEVEPGELKDLLELALLLRDIYEAPPESHDQLNRALIVWLQKQPEIKREFLSGEVRDVAWGYQLILGSTIEALNAAFPPQPKEQTPQTGKGTSR